MAVVAAGRTTGTPSERMPILRGAVGERWRGELLACEVSASFGIIRAA